MPSSTLVQESAPFALITVYLTGTTQLASLYANNFVPPTPLSNPFTANDNGYWFFYAPDGRYDVMIEAPDWTWTMGDIKLSDSNVWSADQDANGHWLRGLGGIAFDNGRCRANITFDANCNLIFTGTNGQLLASLGQQGNLLVTGCMQIAPPGAPMMQMCVDSNGTLNFTNASGASVGSINQGGLLDVPKIVTQQLEATTSIWSDGTLGSQGGIETFGTIVGPKVQTQAVQTPCVQFVQGTGPTYGDSMFLCAAPDGTLEITNNSGTNIGSVSQAGLFDILKLVAQQIEATQSIFSQGTIQAQQKVITPCVQFVQGIAPGPYGPSMYLCAANDGTLEITNDSGTNVGSISQGGLWDIPKLVAQQFEVTQSFFTSGTLATQTKVQTPCVQYVQGGPTTFGPSMWLCAANDGTLEITNDAGTNVGSISQSGLFDIVKLLAQQIEATQSIWSDGTLGSQGGITTNGTIVGPKVQTQAVQTPCVQFVAGTGPTYGNSMWLCAAADGTLEITNNSQTNIGSISQSGFVTLLKMELQQLEATTSIWSDGTLGSTGDISTQGSVHSNGGYYGFGGICINASGEFVSGAGIDMRAVCAASGYAVYDTGGVRHGGYNGVVSTPGGSVSVINGLVVG